MKNAIPILLCFCVAASAASRRSLLLEKKPAGGVAATPVDSFLDFHLETIGQQVSDSFHLSSYGETNWVYTSLAGSTTNRTYYSNIVGTNITLDPAISVGGVVITSTGTNWIREDFSKTNVSANETAVLLKTFSDSVFTEVIFYLRFSKLTNAITSQSKDILRLINPNPYVIPQLGIPVGLPDNSVTPTFGVHTSGGGIGSMNLISVPTETLLRLEIVEDNTNNLAWMRVTDALTGGLIGSGIVVSNGVNSYQSQMEVLAGYFSLPGCTGVLDRTAFILNHTAVNTNRIPWVPVAPSSLVATQTGSGEVTLTLVDQNDRMAWHMIDIWNSGTWTNGITNLIAGTNSVVIRGLIGGSNYNFRAYATLGANVAANPSAKVESGAITLTTANWYDSISYASTDGTQLQMETYWNMSVPVTVSSSGNATKLRIGIGPVLGSVPFKVALFDGSKALLASLTTTLEVADNNTLKEFTIPTTAVTSGTYYIGFTANSSSTTFASKSGTTGTEMHYVNTGFDYAAYPPSNLGSADGTLETISAGVLVQ